MRSTRFVFEAQPKVGGSQWHVQIMTRYGHGQGVETYLARYLRGGPLKPGRMVSWDAQTVTLRRTHKHGTQDETRGAIPVYL